MKPIETDLCPYCRHRVDDRGGPTRDHIFGKAFGGRGTVWVCKRCNDTIGSDVEGVAHRAHQLMAPIKQRAGLGGKVRGLVDLGAGEQAMDIDFATGEVTPVHPKVQRQKDGDQERITVAGSPEQIRSILEGLLPDMAAEDREELIPAGSTSRIGKDRHRRREGVPGAPPWHHAAASGQGSAWCGDPNLGRGFRRLAARG